MPAGTAVTNRTISFGAQPLFPPGIDGSDPGPFFPLYFCTTQKPLYPGTQFGSALTSPNTNNMSGIVFFPGSLPLYRNGVLVGGLGVSGDGVDQDDFVTGGAVNAACGAGGPCGVPIFRRPPHQSRSSRDSKRTPALPEVPAESHPVRKAHREIRRAQQQKPNEVRGSLFLRDTADRRGSLLTSALFLGQSSASFPDFGLFSRFGMLKSLLSVLLSLLLAATPMFAAPTDSQTAGEVKALIPAAWRNSQPVKVKDGLAWNDLLQTSTKDVCGPGLPTAPFSVSAPTAHSR